PRRARARPPRAGGRVPRRRHRAHAAVEGPRLLEGGPRHEHRAHRLGRLAADAARRRSDHGRDLAVRGDAAEGARAGRAVRDVRRGVRLGLGRGVRGPRPDDVESLEVFTLTSRELSDLDMIASGALSPLEGFLGRDDYERVVAEMRLANGLPWALPVCLAVDAAPVGERVALADESGRLYAVLEVDEVFEYDKEREAQHCFSTTDDAHPGVARLYEQKPLYLAGRVTVFERSEPEFPELARDPAETRAVVAERGWQRVVGFQTRNPIHRAHEYLTKAAPEHVDGLHHHPPVGGTTPD